MLVKEKGGEVVGFVLLLDFNRRCFGFSGKEERAEISDLFFVFQYALRLASVFG